MKLERLFTIAEIKNGYAFGSNDYVESGARVIRITNVQKGNIVDDDPKFVDANNNIKYAQFFLNAGDILISLTGNVGRVGRVPANLLPALLNQRVGLIRPSRENIFPDYLFQILNSAKFEKDAITNSKGIAQLNLSSKWVGDYQIPLPPLDDQKRIAYLLGKVEGMISRRKEHIKQLDELLKSVFLEMFGDPDRMKTLKHHSLGEIISFLTSGSRGWAKYYSESGDIFIRINNVKDASFKLDDIVYVNAPISAEADRTRLKQGDLLLSITADLGRTAVVTKELEGAYINQHLALIRIKAEENINPLYLAWYFTLPYGRSFIQKKNREGVKAGLNFDDIRSFQFIKPPIELQNQFGSIVEKVESLKLQYQDNLTYLENLYGALSQKAFKGELDLRRVVMDEEEKEVITATMNASFGPISSKITSTVVKPFSIDYLIKYLSTQKGKKLTFDQIYDSLPKKDDVNVPSRKELQKMVMEQLENNNSTIIQIYDYPTKKNDQESGKQILFKVKR